MIDKICLEIINEADQKEEILVSLKIQDSICQLLYYSKIGNGEFEASDFFECLKALRYFLEEEGYLICCYGARYDVYPSKMSRQMAKGKKAYLLETGKSSTKDKLVDIFQPTSVDKIDTVKKQKEYYQSWLKSLN